jgi:hypothetical protein
MRLRLALFAGTTTAFACAFCNVESAQSATDIRGVISHLADRMYVVGETTARLPDFENAINEARKAIKDLAAADGELLTKKDTSGATPLITASYLGYAGVVEDLLAYKQVKDAINDVDSNGFSAWIAANFTAREALWVCNPMVLKDPFKIVPILVEQPYYSSGPEAPYVKVRRMLEEAGARHDMDEAKRLWASFCQYQDSTTREATTSSSDLQDYVRKAGQERLAALMKGRLAPGSQK